MADSNQVPVASTSNFQATFGNMTDSQLRETLTQISNAANRPEQFQAFASPIPQSGNAKAYLKNLHTWSTSTTPPPGKGAHQSTRSRRTNRTSALSTPQPQAPYTVPVYQPPAMPVMPALPPNPPRPPIPTNPQALQSSYASRLRTGVTLLMQPIIQAPTNATARTSRRGAVINYADPGSGDDIPDAGELDSDDSDFQASGGTRTALRQARANRMGAGMNVFHANTGRSTLTVQPQIMFAKTERSELDQSYLGAVPPSRFIKSKPFAPTSHEYPTQDSLELQAQKPTALVPIRVEFETDTHRIRDCFVWNLYENLIKPETFARIFCHDLDLPLVPWADTVANQIKAQLEEHEGVASMDFDVDGYSAASTDPTVVEEEAAECRVILSIDVQIGTYHLLDHIEWDLLSPLTPESFSQRLCADLGLSGEASSLISHAIHEEIIKHKKDAIEWGVIGGDAAPALYDTSGASDRPRDRSGFSLVKDKTGLGLGWGRAPKDGRGPKPLKSVWRDWTEAEEFRTRFEVLSQEEVERREIEKERASRRLRRETSKFQSSTRTRRR